MTRRPVAWRWSDVDAMTTASETRLTHRLLDAQLTVTRGRLVGGRGYTLASAAVRRDLARVGAIVRLRERGRYMIHAAGIVDPAGGAWLLSGESGAGKSTLAYALVRAGWTALGDDGVLVEVDGSGIIAHPWKDPLQVSRALDAEFPELRQHATRARRDDSRQRIPMSVAVARSSPLCGLISVERSDVHSVTRVGSLAALGMLIRQSPLVMVGDDHARAHLAALRDTAALPCFRLRHTPAELQTIARVVGTMVA